MSTISNPTETLETVTAKNFILGNKLSVVPTVRTNVNGYPYITFIDESNNAENIYFSKNSSKDFPKDTPIQKGFFDNISFVKVKYSDDREDQWKMTNGSGNRVTGASLF